MTQNEPLLAFEAVHKGYDARPVLEGISFAVHAGRIVALLGGNGAGKTTCLKLALGVERPDAGFIRIDAGGDAAQARRRVAFVPEVPSLYDELDAWETVVHFTAIAAGRAPARTDCAAALAAVGLPEPAWHRKVSQLSKGQRQKVSLAVALSQGARVLLLDEPTSGLDAGSARELNALLTGLAHRGAAILMATHDVMRVREIAAEGLLLRGGRIVHRLDTKGADPLAIEQLLAADAVHADAYPKERSWFAPRPP